MNFYIFFVVAGLGQSGRGIVVGGTSGNGGTGAGVAFAGGNDDATGVAACFPVPGHVNLVFHSQPTHQIIADFCHQDIVVVQPGGDQFDIGKIGEWCGVCGAVVADGCLSVAGGGSGGAGEFAF